MDAKKLYKKHLDKHIPKDKFMSDKQMEQARYDATIDAINEALTATNNIRLEKSQDCD